MPNQYGLLTEPIFYSGTLLKSLIDDVLDLSKIEADKYVLVEEPLDVFSQIKISIHQLSLKAEAPNRVISSEISPDLPALRGDGRALIQVLNNLLSNALKFTPDGGKISIAGTVNEGNSIVLAVTDTGIGMSEDDIVKALQPFEQVYMLDSPPEEGTGLGLHLSAKIMTLFGGTLTINSEVAKGTTVTLEFPPERTIHPT
jgi:signal transduction histidine kinase